MCPKYAQTIELETPIVSSYHMNSSFRNHVDERKKVLIRRQSSATKKAATNS